MVLISVVLMHDMRLVREEYTVRALSRTYLIFECRHRETRCRHCTYFKVTCRVINEAYAARVSVLSGIYDEGLVTANLGTVFIEPQVVKAVRCVTNNLSIVTAVLRLNICRSTFECEVSVSKVSTTTAVTGSKAHFDRMSTILQ